MVLPRHHHADDDAASRDGRQQGVFRRDAQGPVTSSLGLRLGRLPGDVLAAKLVNELVEAADERQLSRTVARYGRVD